MNQNNRLWTSFGTDLGQVFVLKLNAYGFDEIRQKSRTKVVNSSYSNCKGIVYGVLRDSRLGKLLLNFHILWSSSDL